MTWKNDPHYWPFVGGIQWIPLRKGQWCGVLTVSLLLVWICCLTNSRYVDDFRRQETFPCYWSFVRGIHRRPVNSSHKGPVMRKISPVDVSWSSSSSWYRCYRHYHHSHIILYQHTNWVGLWHRLYTYKHFVRKQMCFFFLYSFIY